MAPLLLALALSTAPLPADADAPRLLASGAVAPELGLERAQGGKLTLASLKGRVVLVDFWATWCPPCRAELPFLVKLAQRFQDRGLVLVAVNQDDAPAQKALVAEFAPSVPGLLPRVVYGTPATTTAWHIDGLPTLYLVDPKGRVFAASEGFTSEEDVERAVTQALQALQPPAR
jgi:thiol-disulfide isomerase/thioredoxin